MKTKHAVVFHQSLFALLSFIGLLLFSAALNAKPLSKEKVPEPLKPWISWALFNQDKQSCTHAFDQAQQVFCAWPASLKLEINKHQGSFSQQWQVQAESWVRLPGDSKLWPHDVLDNGQKAVVVSHQGYPAIKLAAGQHLLSGKFLWESLPETLSIPPSTGLIQIRRDGKAVDFPRINQKGQLWLDKSLQQKSIQDALDVQIYRKIDDAHPLQVQTRLILHVAGRSRDISFANIQLDGFIPLRLKSQLPARINRKGDLLVQVRPGNWQINLVSYKSGMVSELKLPQTGQKTGINLPKQEVWVFKSNPALRLAEISGVPAIDSRQTRLPDEWRSLPAYLMDANKTMRLKTLQRGSASPEPNRLRLRRAMWMDFDGGGYTINDHITGTMSRGWRLVSAPELQLGSARMDAQAQFITTLAGGKDTGIEVRRGKINLEAASRYTDSLSSLPASGWKHDFQRVNTTLFLAPGWKLFSAYGSDNLPRTWLQSWTLLDIFLVLIIAVAITRLWDWKWGLFALLTMTLIWHETGAPKYIWLNLIAAIALLRVLPDGFFKRLVWSYRNLVLLVLLLIIIPFSIHEVRNGLYPQLGLYSDYASVFSTQYSEYAPTMEDDTVFMDKPVQMPMSAPSMTASKKIFRKKSAAGSSNAYLKKDRRASNVVNQMLDPNANIQTGPGLPTWDWQAVYFSWNSPVKQDQKLELTLLSPGVNLLLNFLRVIFLLILIWRLLRVISNDKKSIKKGGDGFHFKLPALSSVFNSRFFKNGVFGNKQNLVSMLMLPLLAVLLLAPQAHLMAAEKIPPQSAKPPQSAAPQQTAFPSEAMLQTLQQRLLEKPDCLPDCAQIEAMRLELAGQELRIYLQLHSAAKVAVPLPGNRDQWQAEQVLLDNAAAKNLYRDNNGVLWIGLEKGISNIIMQGRLPKQPQIQLGLPLPPKYVEWKGTGWTVEGIRENHVPAQQLQLLRKQEKKTARGQNQAQGIADQFSADNNYLPPLLQVERTLHLGLDWFVDTRVTRLSPTGTPLSMKIPLLPGESVLSNAYSVKNGKLLINMSSTQRSIQWQSQIPVADQLSLVATRESGLIESWKLDISPIWHVVISGIPEIHHENQTSVWLPEWQPWPGEKVELQISRPQGIAGRTLTIERSILNSHIGKRLRDTQLILKIRSSRGGQHPIILPEHAELISVKIDGKLQPVRQQQRKVSLPISPGEQTIMLNWRSNEPITSKITMLPVNVGIDNVNSSLQLALGRDRWILFTHGPTMGPAVLFWGVLLVILLASVILGRIKNSPLKAWQWFLLGAGLSLATPLMIIIVVGWLLALSYRPMLKEVQSRLLFNGAQILLVLLTLIALGSLFFALQQGLLGWPDMQIAGNASNAWELRWYQDRSGADLPQPWVFSVPLLVYRILMLLWSLWLAFSLISWLRQGWHNFAEGGLWRKGKKRVKNVKNDKS